MLKVVILGATDWAGSAYQACRAINSVGEVDCRAITLYKHERQFAHDMLIPVLPVSSGGDLIEHMSLKGVKSDQYEEAAEVLNQADIIHMWNCLHMDPRLMFSGLPLQHSKVKVATWTGTTYRDGHGKINAVSQYWNRWKTVVQDPLFKFPDEVDATFIPHAIDVDAFKPLPFEEREKWIGVYQPTYNNPVRLALKDIEIVRKLVKKYDGWGTELDYGMPHAERMEKLRYCSMFVLDLSPFIASWGRSALEACVLGIPAVQNTSIECIEKLDGALGDLGFVNTTFDTAEETISKLIEDEGYRKTVGVAARKWVEDYFSYPVVGRKYTDVYRSVL